MNLINNNPFRLLDIPVTASEREITKQINKLETLAAMGKSNSFDSDYSFLKPVDRSIQSINDAKKQIENSESKFHYSLFWFWINSNKDRLAFDFLKAGNINKAIEVWDAACKEEYLDSSYKAAYINISYFKNLSTLYLSLSINNKSFHKDYFIKGIKLAETFFSSNDIEHYSKQIAGDNYIYKVEKALHFYLNDLINSINSFIDSEDGISTTQLYNLFSSFPIESKQFLNSKFILKQKKYINEEIEKSIAERKKSPLNSIEVGKKLIENTKSDLTYLKDILGADDFQYQIIADKLALEIIQNGIDSFNAHKNEKGETDYPKAIKSEESYLSEYEYALQISSSPATKARAKENLESCKEAISNKYLFNCWFCGENAHEDSCKYTFTIYRVNSRAYRKVSYSYLPYTIQRCNKCQQLHSNNSTIMTLSVISLGILGAVIAIPLEAWFGGLIVGLLVGWGIGALIISEKNSKNNIKGTSNSSLNNHPGVQNMIAQGWQLNKPSA
ncbi:MAG: hypothetical protein NTU73_06415 [Ignavibacteriae bacterium]|nr:hypothetical protein [Ignavibacteriota bacterium]